VVIGLLEQLGWWVAPTTADNVIISTGHIVTITASTSITDLNLSATNSKLVINSSMTLTVVGTFANSGTTTNGVNGPGTICLRVQLALVF
jgi:uncharacterized YccA/Bax inhibitor family protein